MAWKVQRIIMEREGSGELRPTSRFRIVKITGVMDGKVLTPTEPPEVLERGLTVAEARVRVKVWRAKDNPSVASGSFKGIYP